MTNEQLHDYAETLIREHVRDIEFLSIHEMAEEHLGHEISDDDARKVDDLITKAAIAISWDDKPEEGQ